MFSLAGHCSRTEQRAPRRYVTRSRDARWRSLLDRQGRNYLHKREYSRFICVCIRVRTDPTDPMSIEPTTRRTL
jgi:hypothetical protein